MEKIGKSMMDVAVYAGFGLMWIGIGTSIILGAVFADLVMFLAGIGLIFGGFGTSLTGYFGRTLFRIAETNEAVLERLKGG